MWSLLQRVADAAVRDDIDDRTIAATNCHRLACSLHLGNESRKVCLRLVRTDVVHTKRIEALVIRLVNIMEERRFQGISATLSERLIRDRVVPRPQTAQPAGQQTTA